MGSQLQDFGRGETTYEGRHKAPWVVARPYGSSAADGGANRDAIKVVWWRCTRVGYELPVLER